MSRVQLTDDSGRWFDNEKGDNWGEATRWNGNNHISLATGSQWNHERLYKTASNRWILYAWSQWQGSMDSYTEISKTEALRWLAVNEHDMPEEFAAEFSRMEV
jgi:hypothetical protein